MVLFYYYFFLSDLKKDILDIELKNKIEKITNNNNSTKINVAFGNFLLSKYEQKTKNYEKELNYLTKGHNSFFDTQKAKFELMVKYSFDDMLQISEGVEVE